MCDTPIARVTGCVSSLRIYFGALYILSRQAGAENESLMSSSHLHVHFSCTLPCQLNEGIFPMQRLLACPSVPAEATARAVPAGGKRNYSSSSASCRCIGMRGCVDMMACSLGIRCGGYGHPSGYSRIFDALANKPSRP